MIEVTAALVEDTDHEETRYFSEHHEVRLKPSTRDRWGTRIIFPDGAQWTVKRPPETIARKIDNARNNQ